MRLHRLRLDAFGPFATAQEIDFDQVGTSGLFLLEGPTGAGKTSILDAITFALYGGLAGRDAGTDRQRSHFAGPEVESHVELEFSTRGVRHRVRRTPEWLRPKRRGDGFVKQAQTVHLERLEPTGWRSLSSNKAEAGELIADLVGLNREQFTQVVLLPQGEFAEFLKAGDDDRRRLLTKIFGTDLYDAITAELSRQRAEAQFRIDQARSTGNDRLSAAAEAAGLDASDSVELIAADDPDRRGRLDRLDRELSAVVEAALGRATQQAAARTELEQRHVAARHRHELAGRRVRAETAMRIHRLTEPDHHLDQARLTAAGRAAGVLPVLRILDEQTTITETIRQAVLALAPAEPEVLTGRRNKDLVARATRLTRAADALTPVVELELAMTERQDRLADAQLDVDAATKRLDQLRDREAELPVLLNGAREQLGAARTGEAQIASTRTRLALLVAQAEAATAVDKLEVRLIAVQQQRATAIDTHQRAVDDHQRSVELRLHGMAAELAGALRPDEPCSVCGSAVHPDPARSGPGAVTATDVDAAARRRTAAEIAREQIEHTWAGLSAELSGHRAAAGGQRPDALLRELELTNAELYESVRLAATLVEAEATLTEREFESRHLHTALQTAAGELAARREQCAALELEVITAADRIESSRAEFDSVTRHQADLRHQAEVAAALAEAVAEFDRSRSEQEKTLDRAVKAADAAGFEDVDAVRAAVIEGDEFDGLERRIREWTRTADRLQTELDADDLAGVDADAFGLYSVELNAAEAALTGGIEADRHARAAAGAAIDRRERFGLRHAEYEQAAEAVIAAEAAGSEVIQLAALARGTAGHRRTNLTTYVLRHWFSRVVDAANSRLTRMSSGRYALIRTDTGSRASERAGLTLRVVDQHTGEERSTTSMSGGETFYTSLALALGLADVVSAEAGGVELDTLFIDEGFGTLDAETLDQVMAVIDELRDHGRVVGIVSHVAELKDRVPERIEVRRRPDGSSGLRVLA